MRRVRLIANVRAISTLLKNASARTRTRADARSFGIVASDCSRVRAGSRARGQAHSDDWGARPSRDRQNASAQRDIRSDSGNSDDDDGGDLVARALVANDEPRRVLLARSRARVRVRECRGANFRITRTRRRNGGRSLIWRRACRRTSRRLDSRRFQVVIVANEKWALKLK